MKKEAKWLVAKNPDELAEMLGLSKADSLDWQLQIALLKRLRQIVAKEGYTHAEIARRGRSSRPRVTAILNGNLDDVSSDLLIRLLAGLGYRVKITVTKAA